VGWASIYIAKLRTGETVSFRPRGHSMTGKIESGQLCTVAPVNVATLKVGDIVLCKVGGSEYLHLVKAIRNDKDELARRTGCIDAGGLHAGAGTPAVRFGVPPVSYLRRR